MYSPAPDYCRSLLAQAASWRLSRALDHRKAAFPLALERAGRYPNITAGVMDVQV